LKALVILLWLDFFHDPVHSISQRKA
jgi:hypothetical protein